MTTVKPNYIVGGLILAIIAIQIGREIVDHSFLQYGLIICLVSLVVVLSTNLRGSIRIFLVAAIALTVTAIALDPDWHYSVWKSLLTSGFYVAFFSSLATLKNAAGTSPSITAAGTYLARQPAGRRYIALSAGTQAFAILLNYGSIQLLGTLALASANSEADERIRKIRIRRMLQAIHRGFISSLPWSPLSFSLAISVSVIPGTSWSQLAIPGLVSSIIMLGTGWALDSMFRSSAPAGSSRPTKPLGSWKTLLPLGVLLLIMLTALIVLSTLFSVRVIGLVLMIIPVLSVLWIIVQLHGVKGLSDRLKPYVGVELPSYAREVMLIATAGYIGVIGSILLGPWMEKSGIDLTALPTWLVLLGLVWFMPILGQIGANPILSMSLIGPLLPPAESLGITPTGLAIPLICGWAMTGISSPFTATNLLIGRFGSIRPIEVGWLWNCQYFFLTIGLLCLWSLFYAYTTGSM